MLYKHLTFAQLLEHRGSVSSYSVVKKPYFKPYIFILTVFASLCFTDLLLAFFLHCVAESITASFMNLFYHKNVNEENCF